MKKSTFTIALSTAFACAVLQSRPAMAQLKTQTVDYKQADTALEGYLAYDGSVAVKRPGILVVHHRNGLDAFTKSQADKLAYLGYVVFAADIFGKGVMPKDTKEAEEQSTKYNKDRPLMRTRAQAGLDWMRANPMIDMTRIATVGYCFGGTVVFELAHTGAPVVGTVSIHGSFRDFTPGAAKNINGRVLILHGAEDPVAPLSEVDLVVKELRQTKVDWQVELYSGTQQGFTRPTDAANERANVRRGPQRRNFSRKFSRTRAMRKGRRCSWVLAHTDHNETTATATSKAMKDFVRTVFKFG